MMGVPGDKQLDRRQKKHQVFVPPCPPRPQMIDPNEKVNVETEASESEDEESESEMPPPRKRRQSSLTSIEKSSVGSKSSSHQAPSSSTEECSVSAKERESPSSSGVSRCPKRKWTEEEVKAVENKLLDCITSGRVPGKSQCEDCIRSAPVLLKHRTWESVKFYIKNRITAFKRECEKRKNK